MARGRLSMVIASPGSNPAALRPAPSDNSPSEWLCKPARSRQAGQIPLAEFAGRGAPHLGQERVAVMVALRVTVAALHPVLTLFFAMVTDFSSNSWPTT